VRNAVQQGAATNVEAVGDRLRAACGVDDELDLAALDGVHAVGAAFEDLVHDLPVSAESVHPA